jgi:hypothetical protein
MTTRQSEQTRISWRTKKFARLAYAFATLGTAFIGLHFAPKHSCRLCSSVLMALLFFTCFVLLPILAFRAKSSTRAFAFALLAPVVTLILCLFYLEVLHWNRFPKWLLDKRSEQSSIPNLQSAIYNPLTSSTLHLATTVPIRAP